MAIKLIANYSKKLGLPGYSSHQFSVSVETELPANEDIPAASARLYQTLQSSVDEQIQAPGFLPPMDYALDPPSSIGQDQTDGRPHATAAPAPNVASWQRGPAWKCSDKQRDLILKLVEEHQLDKNNVEALAVERFGKGVKTLNKVEASGLIDELLDTHGPTPPKGQGNRRNGSAYAVSNGANGRRAA